MLLCCCLLLSLRSSLFAPPHLDHARYSLKGKPVDVAIFLEKEGKAGGVEIKEEGSGRVGCVGASVLATIRLGSTPGTQRNVTLEGRERNERGEIVSYRGGRFVRCTKR